MQESAAFSELVRGSIDTIILNVLLREDNYGYQIIKEIYRKSGREFELKEPTLYSSCAAWRSRRHWSPTGVKKAGAGAANITGSPRRAKRYLTKITGPGSPSKV